MLHTDNPIAAGQYIAKKLRRGLGASVKVPDGTIFFFCDASLFACKGLYVSSTKGGTVVFPTPSHVNKFACMKARMSWWSASFVESSLLHAIRGNRRVAKLPHLNQEP